MVEQWKAYSWGSSCWRAKIEMLTGAVVIENGAASCLDNPETGGRMQFDLFLPKYQRGPGVSGSTAHPRARSGSPTRPQLRRPAAPGPAETPVEREAGITLIEVFPQDLSFDRLAELLRVRPGCR